MSISETNSRTSYDGNSIADLTSVIAEFPEGDDEPNHLPIKKLQGTFDIISATEKQQQQQSASLTTSTLPKHDNNMKVFVRIRPIAPKLESTVHVTSDTTISTTAPSESRRAKNTQVETRHYTFHRAFGPDLSQSIVFDQAITPLVTDRFLKGESCILFAYGISNAGKTHTILGTPVDPGIIPRLVTTVHDTLPMGQKDELKVSMFEIYQEKIYDLLCKRNKLTIRDANGRAEVAGLSMHSVTSPMEAQKLLNKGSSKRVSSKTLLNSGSSRSHAIYQLTLRGQVFMIIDLAGAERNNRTLATGNQQKEANNINMSLMQLWRCLYAVKKKTDSQEMVPFRESKLTHILMPTLYRVGTAGAAMIACINPQSADYDESISVLGNASLACEINVKEIAPPPPPAQVVKAAGMLKKLASRSSTASFSSRGSASSNSMPVTNTASSNSASTTTLPDNNTTVPLNKESKKRKADENDEKIVENDEKMDVMDSNEVEVLKKEVESLRAMNKMLLCSQVDREQELRMEVCNEMAKYSQNLLDQIRELQDELYDLKTSAVDVRKSVKKVKREQRSLEHEEAIKNLSDAEEEMERQKRYYDAEIKTLKQEVRSLTVEVADWKLRAETTNDENKEKKQLSSKRNPLGNISPNVSPSLMKEGSDLVMKQLLQGKDKEDKRSKSPYRDIDPNITQPGIAPPTSPKLLGTGPFYTRSMRSTTVRI